MKVKKSVGQPVIVGEYTIMPLEEVVLSCQTEARAFSVYATKRILSLIIRTPEMEIVIDL